MISGPLALTAAAMFTGAAIYMSWAEHPARLGIDDRALLAQWKPSYARGFTMQSALAVIGFVFGVLAWWASVHWAWLAGAVVLVANWPYTLVVIMPTNHILNDIPLDEAGPKSRALLEKWGNLHAVRSVLGAISTALFLWASL